MSETEGVLFCGMPAQQSRMEGSTRSALGKFCNLGEHLGDGPSR